MSAYQRCGGVNRRGRARGLRAATGALALGIVCVAAAGCAQPLNRTPAAAPATAGTADVRIWTDRLTLSTRQVHPDPVPRFQATDGRKFYPYPAQTDLADSPQDHPWTVICMENRYLLGEFRGHHIYLAPSFLLGSSGDIIFSSGDIIFISRRLFSWGRVSDAEGPGRRCSPIP